ncbi:hypothetical protein PCE1_000590 [Barthelona sp. PCE]
MTSTNNHVPPEKEVDIDEVAEKPVLGSLLTVEDISTPCWHWGSEFDEKPIKVNDAKRDSRKNQPKNKMDTTALKKDPIIDRFRTRFFPDEEQFYNSIELPIFKWLPSVHLEVDTAFLPEVRRFFLRRLFQTLEFTESTEFIDFTALDDTTIEQTIKEIRSRIKELANYAFTVNEEEWKIFFKDLVEILNFIYYANDVLIVDNHDESDSEDEDSFDNTKYALLGSIVQTLGYCAGIHEDLIFTLFIKHDRWLLRMMFELLSRAIRFVYGSDSKDKRITMTGADLLQPPISDLIEFLSIVSRISFNKNKKLHTFLYELDVPKDLEKVTSLPLSFFVHHFKLPSVSTFSLLSTTSDRKRHFQNENYYLLNLLHKDCYSLIDLFCMMPLIGATYQEHANNNAILVILRALIESIPAVVNDNHLQRLQCLLNTLINRVSFILHHFVKGILLTSRSGVYFVRDFFLLLKSTLLIGIGDEYAMIMQTPARHCRESCPCCVCQEHSDFFSVVKKHTSIYMLMLVWFEQFDASAFSWMISAFMFGAFTGDKTHEDILCLVLEIIIMLIKLSIVHDVRLSETTRIDLTLVLKEMLVTMNKCFGVLINDLCSRLSRCCFLLVTCIDAILSVLSPIYITHIPHSVSRVLFVFTKEIVSILPTQCHHRLNVAIVGFWMYKLGLNLVDIVEPEISFLFPFFYALFYVQDHLDEVPYPCSIAEEFSAFHYKNFGYIWTSIYELHGNCTNGVIRNVKWIQHLISCLTLEVLVKIYESSYWAAERVATEKRHLEKMTTSVLRIISHSNVECTVIFGNVACLSMSDIYDHKSVLFFTSALLFYYIIGYTRKINQLYDIVNAISKKTRHNPANILNLIENRVQFMHEIKTYVKNITPFILDSHASCLNLKSKRSCFVGELDEISEKHVRKETTFIRPKQSENVDFVFSVPNEFSIDVPTHEEGEIDVLSLFSNYHGRDYMLGFFLFDELMKYSKNHNLTVKLISGTNTTMSFEPKELKFKVDPEVLHPPKVAAEPEPEPEQVPEKEE